MTISEAKRILHGFYMIPNPSEEERFVFVEALSYLIAETKDSNYMVELGAYYYGERRFDLALKYYDMAAECGNQYAMSNLGYIWYYGRTGEKDYQKAFRYFSAAADRGDLIASYKVADMYKNGYYVEKDYARYCGIIEELYPKVRTMHHPEAPVPEIFTRLAAIRTEQGRTDEALALYDRARTALSRRIQDNPFFGNLTIMKWLITDTYKLRPFDWEDFGLYDLFELLRAPVRIRFQFEDEPHEVECTTEDGVPVIRFDDHWYRTVDDFFKKAELDGELLTSLYSECYDFEVF